MERRFQHVSLYSFISGIRINCARVIVISQEKLDHSNAMRAIYLCFGPVCYAVCWSIQLTFREQSRKTRRIIPRFRTRGPPLLEDYEVNE